MPPNGCQRREWRAWAASRAFSRADISGNSAVIWTENGSGIALSNAVGFVDVDTAVTQTCTLRLVREDGVELHREVVALR